MWNVYCFQTELEVISPVADPDESDISHRPVDLDVTGKAVTDRVMADNFRYSCSLHSRSPSHVSQWTDHRERGNVFLYWLLVI